MLIKIHNLSYVYAGQETPALKDISLEVNEGDFVTLCGCSGSGKSTLLRNLKPEICPKGDVAGEILYQGKVMNQCAERMLASEIGYVSQSIDYQIVTDQVWHELAFGMESLGYEQAVIRQRVSEMAMFFGIQGWFHKAISELSGGQKQILSLASVMTLSPKVILLDEPTSQLDPVAASEFLDMLKKINQELGVTIVITEHRLDEIIPMSNQLIVLDYGELYVQGTPLEVCAKLKKTGHPMAKSMPVPVRVWSQINDLEKKRLQLDCPLDVKDGRSWLKKTCQIKNLQLNKNISMKKEDISAKMENISMKKENISVKMENHGEFTSNKIAVSVSDLYFGYDKNEPDVLKGTSFSVKESEIYCILGGNGTGKSTLLSVMMGLTKSQGGKVDAHGNKMGMLPQNPMSLFVKKTVSDELVGMHPQERQNVMELCHLENLLMRHPYDLSGGEQQRLALAKVLLNDVDILLLDEPTKGFDQQYKLEFMRILKMLQQKGKTILIVSHDVEFCAEIADRCALFFDGDIVSENSTHGFFEGNRFFTTAANRMSRGVIDHIITAGELIAAITESSEDGKNSDEEDFDEEDSDRGDCDGKDLDEEDSDGGDFNFHVDEDKSELNKKNPGLRNLIMAIIVLLVIPFTIYVGIRYLGNQKYIFISLVVLLESMIPFVMVFEGRNPQARELVMIATICAICIAGRAVFYMLPEFKPVVALVVISGISLGAESGFMIGALTMLVSNMMFGQGPWTPWQMFALGMVGFISGILFPHMGKKLLGLDSKWKELFCVACMGIFGGMAAVVIYGGVMNFSALILSSAVMNKETIISYYALGFPIDLIRGIATIVFTMLLAKPMIEKIARTREKYGLL